MLRLKYLVIVVLLIFTAGMSNAQELNCTVEINSDKISGTDKSVFTTWIIFSIVHLSSF